jgi:hypothetical protein
MPIVFGDHEAGYGPDEAEAGPGELMALYNSINEAVVEDRAALPADCVIRTPTVANLEEHAPVAEWSAPFGHVTVPISLSSDSALNMLGF